MQRILTAIIGAGMMGTAIAATHLRNGLPIVLYDSVTDMLDTAPQRVAEELSLQKEPFPASLLTCSNVLDDAVRCNIVIETITEKLKAKQKLYQKITVNRQPDFLLFTNTSTLSISLLAEGLPNDWQKQFCGFHFFHPVRQRSLLEIIAGKNTDQQTVELAKEHALRINKRPIVVGDAPGFLVNRILNPFLSSALSLLEEGVDLRRIEQAAVNFGMKMGPFRMMDEIGLDVVLHAGWVLFKAFPDRVPQSPILLQLVERGELGRKTQRGFMSYSKSVLWDGDGVPMLQFLSENNAISETETIHRLFVPMYEEAVRCFHDGIISDLSDADLASVDALGFPAERGGIVTWGKLWEAGCR